MRLSYLSCLLLIILPILLFFVTRGVVFSDEGYILNSSEKIINGLFPYRDFHFPYTPLSLLLTNAVFSIFKISIFSSRMLVLAAYFISSLLIFKTVFIATKNKFYATLSLFLFLAWGPTYINFSWPPVYSALTGLLMCYLFMKFTQIREVKYLFLAGLAGFLVFTSEQSFGIAILVPAIVFMSVRHARTFSFVSFTIYGYLWGVILFGIYLLANQAFPQFIHNFSFFPQYLKESFIPQSLIQIILFNAVPVVSVTSFILLYIRRRFHLLFLPIFVLSFYIVILTSQNYNSFPILISLVGIPISLYLRYNVSTNIRILLISASLLIIFFGFQTALFGTRYDTNQNILKSSDFYPNAKANIFVDKRTKNELTNLVEISNQCTSSQDYLYVHSNKQMLYFILDRKDPVKYSYFLTKTDSNIYYKNVIGNLVAKKVKMIIIDRNSINLLPIKDFINTYYRYHGGVTDFDIYLLRS
jgi:hypothetical protein